MCVSLRERPEKAMCTFLQFCLDMIHKRAPELPLYTTPTISCILINKMLTLSLTTSVTKSCCAWSKNTDPRARDSVCMYACIYICVLQQASLVMQMHCEVRFPDFVYHHLTCGWHAEESHSRFVSLEHSLQAAPTGIPGSRGQGDQYKFRRSHTIGLSCKALNLSTPQTPPHKVSTYPAACPTVMVILLADLKHRQDSWSVHLSTVQSTSPCWLHPITSPALLKCGQLHLVQT